MNMGTQPTTVVVTCLELEGVVAIGSCLVFNEVDGIGSCIGLDEFEGNSALVLLWSPGDCSLDLDSSFFF